MSTQYTKLPPPPQNSHLESVRYILCVKLSVASILFDTVATSYTSINLLLEGV